MQEIIQNIKNFIMTFGSARITKIKGQLIEFNELSFFRCCIFPTFVPHLKTQSIETRITISVSAVGIVEVWELGHELIDRWSFLVFISDTRFKCDATHQTYFYVLFNLDRQLLQELIQFTEFGRISGKHLI